jgi:tetratricopeptide (TPR) repeat protein
MTPAGHPRARLLFFRGVLASALFLGASTAAADEAGDKHALELFRQSEQAYDQGRFSDAAALLREAYALKSKPVLLYNLGRAYEGMGDLENAIDAYQRFLDAESTTTDRGAIEQRIATMKRQIEDRKRLEQRQTSSPPPPVVPSEPPAARSVAPWVVASVGAATLVTGTVLGVVALSKHDDALGEPSHEKALDLEGSARDLQRWANVSFVVGGVLLATGVAWALLRGGETKKPSSALLVVRFP